MGSDDRHDNEDFSLEIENAVENFFSHYEENAPKAGAASLETEPDTVSDGEIALDMDNFTDESAPDAVLGEEIAFDVDDSDDETAADAVSEEELALDMDDSDDEPELDIASEMELVLDMDDSDDEPGLDITSEMELTLDMDDSTDEPATVAVSEEELVLDMAGSDDEPGLDIASEVELAFDMDDSTDEPASDTVSGEEDDVAIDDFEPLFDILSKAEGGPEKRNKVLGNSDQKKSVASKKATKLFNSLTEAILTIDWEVSDANVEKARDVIKEIQTAFPILKESRSKEVIDGMLTTLSLIAASPQSVPTSATAQLEKAIPILRGIASGANMEDGYDELIEDVIAGFEACKAENEPAKSEPAESPGLTVQEEISFDNSAKETLITNLEPITLPAGVSRALRQHSEVVARLTPRARKLSNLHTATKGAAKTLLQKLCGLLELQTRAIEDGLSLKCTIAVFPIGKIENLSDFIDFQLKSMGVCLRHARVLENAYKKKPHYKRFWQSIYLLRIAMERQVDDLSRAARGEDTPAPKVKKATVPAALSAIVREHLLAMEECMERAGFISGCDEGCSHAKINEAGKLLREKIAGQIDILRSTLG